MGTPPGFLKDNREMRQADINRVRKAKEHLKAATTMLTNIKWENRSNMEDHCIKDAKGYIQSADYSLDDIINIQQ